MLSAFFTLSSKTIRRSNWFTIRHLFPLISVIIFPDAVQPGIGTYNKRQFITRTVSAVASAIDQGVALHLNDHVKEGFVMKFDVASC
jgi:hypothetical protein